MAGHAKKGRQRGGDHIAGQRAERETSVRGGGEKTATIDTELGITIDMTPADKEAERCAAIKEEIDVKTENLKNALEDLQAALHKEKRTFVKARAAGGIVYTFELNQPGEKVKIKKLGGD